MELLTSSSAMEEGFFCLFVYTYTHAVEERLFHTSNYLQVVVMRQGTQQCVRGKLEKIHVKEIVCIF